MHSVLLRKCDPEGWLERVRSTINAPLECGPPIPYCRSTIDLFLQCAMLREMSTAETAECLGISRINVKVRLHRARGLVRQHFYKVLGTTAAQAFPFHLDR